MVSAEEPAPVPVTGLVPGDDDHLAWKRTTVDGRTALYGVGGEGMPLLFVHGWALGQHSYKAALKRLVHQQCRVIAPALPGFGGTPELPERKFSFAGYAAWLEEFLDAIHVDGPALVVGHSFGGGVSIQLAHDFPERVQSLVLVNSVGGSAWSAAGGRVRSLAERPLWDWGLHFPADVLPLPQIRKVLPVIMEDALPNVLRSPRALVKVGNLARTADLRPELETLRQRGLPVAVLWGRQDQIIPKASFEAVCAALGAEGRVVDGNHNWLLADPDAFGEVMTNSIKVAQAATATPGSSAQTG